MQTIANNKILISIITLFILGMFAYNFLFSSYSTPMPGDLSASTIGNDLLKTLNELQQVTLEREIFSDDRFTELSDFSTDIPNEPTGRPNPFNAIGRD